MNDEELNKLITELVMNKCYHKSDLVQFRQISTIQDKLNLQCVKCKIINPVTYNYVTAQGSLLIEDRLMDIGVNEIIIKSSLFPSGRILQYITLIGSHSVEVATFKPKSYAVALAALEFIKEYQKNND